MSLRCFTEAWVKFWPWLNLSSMTSSSVSVQLLAVTFQRQSESILYLESYIHSIHSSPAEPPVIDGHRLDLRLQRATNIIQISYFKSITFCRCLGLLCCTISSLQMARSRLLPRYCHWLLQLCRHIVHWCKFASWIFKVIKPSNCKKIIICPLLRFDISNFAEYFILCVWGY